MGKSTKVAISLPESVLKDIEKQRKVTGESRSEFFRRAAEQLLKEESEAKIVKEYVEGYRTIPETPEEIEAARKSAVAILAQPWE